MTSQRQRIYNWFIDTLNTNTQDVTFSGNFVFKFWAQQHGVQDFEIINKSEEQLDFEALEVVPVVNTQSIEIPYVEKNKRSDFEQEYYVALRIENRIDEDTNQQVLEFDQTDPKYIALLETVSTIRDTLSFTYDGFKFTVKAREPQVVQTFKYNGNYYTLFAITLNMSAVEFGFYGNEMSFFLAPETATISNTHLLDAYQVDMIIGKQTLVYNNIDFTATDQQTQVNSRNWQVQITINYRGSTYVPDTLLFNELMADSNQTIGRKYRFRATQNGVNYDKLVVVTSINGTYRNNSVQQITAQIERA